MSRSRILFASGIIAAVAMLTQLAARVFSAFDGVKILQDRGLRDTDIGSILTMVHLSLIIFPVIAFAILAIDKINRTSGLLVAIGYPVAFVVTSGTAWIGYICGCKQLPIVTAMAMGCVCDLLLLLALLRVKNMVPLPLWTLAIIATAYIFVSGIGRGGVSLCRQFAGVSSNGLDEFSSILRNATEWPQIAGYGVLVGYFLVQAATCNMAKSK